MSQGASSPSQPEVPITYPHARLKALVKDWTEDGNLAPEELLTAAYKLRDYVLSFQKRAQRPTGVEEAELVYDGARLAMSLHLQACELLIKAILEERMEDTEQVVALAAAGDIAIDEADREAARLRQDLGVIG